MSQNNKFVLGNHLTTISTPANPSPISFGSSFLKSKPLPPLVRAEKVNGNINVSTFVFLPSTLGVNEKTFTVNVLQTNSSELSVYISIDTSPTLDNSFYTHALEFAIPSNAYHESSVIDKLIVHLWDEDPEGSRGTETTVEQPS